MDPRSRAPRLGPRAFSVGGVDSLDGGFVCQHQLRKQTLLRLSANDCYADKMCFRCGCYESLLWSHSRRRDLIEMS